MLPEALRGIEGQVDAAVDEVTLTIDSKDVPAACRILRSDPRLSMNYLRCLSVVDYEGQAGGELPPVLARDGDTSLC